MSNRISSRRELIVQLKDVPVTAEPPAQGLELPAPLTPFPAHLAPLFAASTARLRLEIDALPSAGSADVPRLDSYYRAETIDDDHLEVLRASINADPRVEAAYIKPPDELPDGRNPYYPPSLTPNYTARQGYLEEAPGGVDARFAWSLPGGRGIGVQIVDVEGAWQFSHEDLRMNQGGVIGGVPSRDSRWRAHGTAVAGVLGGDGNGFGITGVCPDANVRAVSIFQNETMSSSSAEAIRKAANALRPGDLLLIELHRAGPRVNYEPNAAQRGYIPVEWWPDDYDAIRYAVGRGIIVVEAGGNGGEDLDDRIYDAPAPGFPSTWTNPFRRGARDSGAILVGAGAPPFDAHADGNGRDHGPDLSRLPFSNYGAAIDTQGWGEEVTTTGYGNLHGGPDDDVAYTDTFSGTSSASPIIVGVLACLQGILRATGARLLDPHSARALLRSGGSPQTAAPGRPAEQRIGARPNLRELIHRLLPST